MKYILRKILLSLILLLPFHLQASLPFDVPAIQEKGHRIQRVDTYVAVREKVDELLARGVPAAEITVLTDWDNVVNGPGAWEQKNYDGSYVCADTKRISREHEVDHRLRDPRILEVHEYLKGMGVHVIVVTARPPIMDAELDDHTGVANTLDIRDPDNPDRIHYDAIHTHVKRTLNEMPDDKVIDASSRKLTKMQNQSRVSLTGQNGLNKSFVHQVNGFKIVYVDGFSFVGHDKGSALLPLYEKLEKKPQHTVIIDDSPGAINSYMKVLGQITGTVHFLYYPKPGQ